MCNYSTYTDPELLDLIKIGDQAAFNEIYQRYWKLLFSVAASKLDDYGASEEVVQDIFADLWRRREVVEITYSLKSYLAGAVKFRVYATLAARQRLMQNKAALATTQIEIATNAVEDAYRIKVLQEELLRAANQLPERCRLIYQLSRDAGYSNKKIARVLLITEKTVENQITRALHHLRKYLRTVAQGLMVFLL